MVCLHNNKQIGSGQYKFPTAAFVAKEIEPLRAVTDYRVVSRITENLYTFAQKCGNV